MSRYRRTIIAVCKPGPCYILPPDITFTVYILLHAVSTVREFWDDLLYYLGVPRAVIGQIKYCQSHSSEAEKRVAGLQYYLQTQTVPCASWWRIASVLWWMEEHAIYHTPILIGGGKYIHSNLKIIRKKRDGIL